MTFQTIALTLWELPQIVFGRMLAKKFGRHVHTVDGVYIYTTDKIEGMSLGDTVFVNPDCSEGTWLVKHEFGHVIQSRYLGWLYLPIVFIPSYLWYLLIDAIDKANIVENRRLTHIYHLFYTEWWANWLVA